VTAEIIAAGIRAAAETGAAIAAVRMTPTVKVVAPVTGLVTETLDRDLLWEVQTPQVFSRALLERAYLEDADGATDDAALVERLGARVKVFAGSGRNIKITTPDDMLIASAFLGC
jgi:2-C-methyl-D-erythritol 4-phosphate cytidylyltransferase